MKRLLLVRHAKSDWSDESLEDFDRPLNKRGKHDAPLMAKFLADQKLIPTYLYSSPANRAYTTARLFADELGLAENDIALEKTLYEASTEQLLRAIQRLPDGHDTAAIFSHNPTLSYTVSHFSGRHVGNVPTCGIGYIISTVDQWKDVNAESAQLHALWIPKAVLSAYA